MTPKRALIGVDGNRDFNTPGGKLYIPQGLPGDPSHEQIISRGITMFYSGLFDHRAFTTENHHPRHIEFGRYGPHAVFGSEGQKYHPDLIAPLAEADIILEKGLQPGIICHSAATSPQFFPHVSMLRYLNIEELYFWGWFYTHCVGRSAIDYAYQDFKVFIVRDATMCIPPAAGDDPEYMDKLISLARVELISFHQLGLKD